MGQIKSLPTACIPSMACLHSIFLPLLQFTTHKVRASWSARDRPLLPKRVVVPINSWFPAGLSKCNPISYIWQDPIIILVPYFPDMMWGVLQIGVPLLTTLLFQMTNLDDFEVPIDLRTPKANSLSPSVWPAFLRTLLLPYSGDSLPPT
jgi:hypothetical protein